MHRQQHPRKHRKTNGAGVDAPQNRRATPATPGAPPRMVTKRLKESVQVRMGNRVYVLAPYAAKLQYGTTHKYVERAKALTMARTKSGNAKVTGG